VVLQAALPMLLNSLQAFSTAYFGTAVNYGRKLHITFATGAKVANDAEPI